jgi:hypothetical protein
MSCMGCVLCLWENVSLKRSLRNYRCMRWDKRHVPSPPSSKMLPFIYRRLDSISSGDALRYDIEDW